MSDTTPKGWPYLLGTDLASDIDQGFSDLADTLETQAAIYLVGDLGSRPTAADAGIGVFYHDDSNNDLYYSDGTSWFDFAELIVQESITNDQIAAAAAIAYSKLDLADSIVDADISASAVIDPTKIAAQPRAQATLASDQSLSSGSFANVSWTAESYDTDTMHDNSTNPDRLTCNTEGLYSVRSEVFFAGAAGGIRLATISLNGSEIVRATQWPLGAGDGVVCLPSIDVPLAASDYLTVAAYQSSGSPINVLSAGSFFQATRISS